MHNICGNLTQWPRTSQGTLVPDVVMQRASIVLQRAQVEKLTILTLMFGLLLGSGCARHHCEEGLASWYGPGFYGKKTASGERFRIYKRTAAHRTLPFDTRVKVINLQNGRSVVVRVNDRGPFVEGRIIDLSRAAARALGMLRDGVVEVRIEVKRYPDGGS